MQKLLIDTAAWAALELGHDAYYRAAMAFKQGAGRGYLWVTTNWIVWETVTLLRNRGTHAKAVQFFDRVMQSPGLEIVPITAAHELLAWEIFQRFDDKEFSGVDCASFAVMKTLHISSAFTFDRHFRQAGFTVLPTLP